VKASDFLSKELTEEQFDEAAGEKDACYRKVPYDIKYGPAHMQVGH
jgi:hypothetical protein